MINSRRKKRFNWVGKAAIAGLFGAAGTAPAVLQIPDVPIFIGENVTPNVFFTLDDSGSMDFEVMPVPHWDYDSYDPDDDGDGGFEGSNDSDFKDSGIWRSRRFIHRLQPGPPPPPPPGPPPPPPPPGPPPPPPPPPGPLSTGSDGTGFKGVYTGSGYQPNLLDPAGLQTSSSEENFAYLYNNTDSLTDGGNVCYSSLYYNRSEACTTDNPASPQTYWKWSPYGYTPAGKDWRVLAPGFNKVFYDAGFTYRPWSLGPCYNDGSACIDALFTNAYSNPRERSGGGFGIARDLSTESLGTESGAFRYDIWLDNRGFTGTEPRRGSNVNALPASPSAAPAPNGVVDLWDSHIVVEIDTAVATITRVDYDPPSSAPASPDRSDQHWALGPTRTTLATLSDPAACYVALGSNAVSSMPTDTETNPSSFGTWMTWAASTAAAGSGCRTIAESGTNIANWYQYYRRRSYAAKAAISEVLFTQPSFRYGISAISSADALFVGSAGGGNTTHNVSLLDDLYKYDWKGPNNNIQGTPLRRALENTGEYFRGNLSVGGTTVPSPIQHECRRNFNLLFTDGYYNGSNPSLSTDVDGDGTNRTLADLARFYYETDLDTVLPNELAPTPQNPQTKQHLVNFGIAFGVNGNLVDVNGDNFPNPTNVATETLNESGQVVETGNPGNVINTSTGGWGNANSDPELIDDLWHAAFNSKGLFASADSPAELVQSVLQALSSINTTNLSSSAPAQNATQLSTGTTVYSASFEPGDWSGDLVANLVSEGIGVGACPTLPLGALCPVNWRAKDELPTPVNRVMLTYNPDASDPNFPLKGIPFRTLGDLSAAQQLALNTNPATAIPDSLGQQRINYLRGDGANEGSGTGQFRLRSNKLGDIVHSDPLLVGAPFFPYSDDLEAGTNKSYSAFRKKYKDRVPTIYVGANDGALHGFNGLPKANGGGKEVMAYVPSSVYPKLNQLTDQNYGDKHKFYVDGDLIFGDAYFEAKGETGTPKWHTVLVGALGRGGQGLFALNVTNPGFEGTAPTGVDPQISEANADRIVMWEFTDEVDARLGNTLSRASLVRMHNGRWAVIIGNGYNNDDQNDLPAPVDDPLAADQSGNAALFIIFIDGGLDGTWTAGTDYIVVDTGIGTEQGLPGDPNFDSDYTDLPAELQGKPNGLAEVTAIDIDDDFIIDYIYGGDLYGNLWRFDVTSNNTTDWTDTANFGALFASQDPVGNRQPITSRPTVGRHPTDNAGVLVHFGTGKYFELDDVVVDTDVNGNSTEQTQTIYGIYDRLIGDPDGTSDHVTLDRTVLPPLPLALLQQKIEGELAGTFIGKDGNTGQEDRFVVTNNAIEWRSRDRSTGKHDGWFLDQLLDDGVVTPDNEGRRIVFRPVFRAGRVFYIVTVPSTQACEVGGDSILLSLDQGNGGGPDQSIFDIDRNRLVDALDKVDLGGSQRAVAGIRFGGLSDVPAFIRNAQDGLIDVYTNSQSDLPAMQEAFGVLGRQSWRQLK